MVIIVFVVILVILIIAHELGHFSAAKLFRVRVDEFGVGFPPKIAGIQKGETLYTVNAIPIGGFVKIYGEMGEGEGDSRSFISQKAYARLVILFAGVAMNFLLAFVLLSFALYLGIPTPVDEGAAVLPGETVSVQIVGVAEGSPAQEAGLKQGDVVLGFMEDGTLIKTETSADVQRYSEAHRGSSAILTVKRGKDALNKEIIFRQDHPKDEGPMGVGLLETKVISYSLPGAFVEGFKYTLALTEEIAVSFYGLLRDAFAGRGSLKALGGPVKIAQITGDVVPLGLPYIFNFAGVLSITLAIINALPFPALDGGRALFVLIEKIKGSPVKQSVENIIHTAGFALLILLMVAITYNDIETFFL